ncbi:DNL-type zinc finger protein [Porphyridium purpureum]|uniref:DNL-type zinc finger protein n=1 Tax=Porphyridium purpureum TaxID=35688 RepID=A0A5J4YZM1_PORPP|nr:DNL-type zinc finger protein [Porphyridium purpureum]|eukprot:POR3907..scf208_2
MNHFAFVGPGLPQRCGTFGSRVQETRERRPFVPVRTFHRAPVGVLMQKGFGSNPDKLSQGGHDTTGQRKKSKASGPIGADQFLLAFTCNVCETRVARKIKKLAYNKGVVIVECPGCANRHLIADNLDWFHWLTDEQKNKTVEDFAREKGQTVVRRSVSADTEGLFEILPDAAMLNESTQVDDAESRG